MMVMIFNPMSAVEARDSSAVAFSGPEHRPPETTGSCEGHSSSLLPFRLCQALGATGQCTRFVPALWTHCSPSEAHKQA